ncbi:FAD-dependent oxidoreductase [Candidatus Sumerlaeota bacterium]|nr:FAD-dependent oxidoreductase [Candidatus Sumerlaeota bacterium]
MSRSILILGAGVCGLAAAWRLLEKDSSLQVTILESAEEPGGLARSLIVGDHIADLGPHRIFTELPDVQDFLHDLAGEDLETVRRASQMWLRGGWIEYPPKPVEVTRHLGVTTLAGAGASFALNKAAELLGARGNERESFESLMTSAFGPQLYELLVAPYARKVWKMSPRRIHADIARVRVSAGGLDQMVKKLFVPEKPGTLTAVRKFYYMAGGVEQLVRKMRAGVESRGGSINLVRNVNAIRFNGRATVCAENKASGRAESYQADDVISTIPLPDLLSMLFSGAGPAPSPAVVKAREDLHYIANFLVAFVVGKADVTDSQWLYFPGPDTVFNRAYLPKNFHSSMGSANETLVVFEITCHHGDRIWHRSDKALVAAALRGAERVGLFRKADVRMSLVHRIPHTYPIYDLGYRRRLNEIRKYLENFPRLINTGRQGLFLHNNMDHSIHMGFRSAEALLAADENPAREFYKEIRKFQQFRIVD